MMLHHKLPLALLLAAAMCLGANVAQAAPPQSSPTDLRLKYNNSQNTCLFHSDGSYKWVSDSTVYLEADGEFDQACNIGGNGATVPASVALTVNGSNQANLEPGESATIAWSANADVCRFDGSTAAAAPDWKANGYACTTSGACAVGTGSNGIPHTFSTAGTYIFKLSCNIGTGTGGGATASKQATVTVAGTPPPSDVCVNNGLTRLTTGLISFPGGQFPETVDLHDWKNVFGQRPDEPGVVKGWPGYFTRSVKFNIPQNKYVALKFTVPQDFPIYSTNWGGGGPYGAWTTLDTLATFGVKWTMSISPRCGDFDNQNGFANGAACYRQFDMKSGLNLFWVVGNSTQIGNMCTLERGQSYFLNIVAAPLGDPLNTTGGGCNQSSCKGNFVTDGNFEGTQNPPYSPPYSPHN